MAKNVDGEILLGVDVSHSKEQIEKDLQNILGNIKKLEVNINKAQLTSEATNELRDQIKGIKNVLLNIDKAEINSNAIDSIRTQLSKIKDLSLNIDKFVIKDNIADDIKKQLSNIKSLSIDLSNLTVNSNAINKNAQQIGQQIANSVNSGISLAKGNMTSFTELRKKMQNISVNSNAFEDYEKILEKVRHAYEEFGQVKITDQVFNEGKLEKFRVNIEQVNGDLKETKSFLMSLNKEGTAFEFGKTIKGYDSVVQHLDKSKNAVNQTAEAVNAAKIKMQSDKIVADIDVSKYQGKVDYLIGRTKQWTDTNGNARISTENLKNALSELNAINTKLGTSEGNTTANQEKLIEAEKRLSAEIKSVENSLKSVNAEFAKDSAINNYIQHIKSFMDLNPKFANKYKTELKGIFSSLAMPNIETSKLNEIKGQFNSLVSTARQAGNLGKGFFDQIRGGIQSFVPWLTASGLVMTGINKFKQGANIVRELDYALVDLRKTANMSAEELHNFYLSSNDVAKQMGVTTQEIIDAASSWSRMGFSTAEQAESMAKLSSMFKSISPGMTMDEAQSGMVSIMKAWGLEVDNVEREVMDNINTLGNKFSETNADIVEGMKRSAAALATTGTSYQDAFALFTGAQEIVQNAEVVGRALRSVSMRIHGYSEESEDGTKIIDENLKNVTGDLINLTKTTQHGQGVSIFKEGSTTEFKSLVDYFSEIHDIWDEMSQQQQNNFLDKAFGKNQAQSGAAIITNIEQVKKALYEMENATGSSEREMSIITDSVSYKINELQETFTGVAQNLFQTGQMKGALDFLIKLGDALDFITDKLGLLGTAATGIATYLSLGKNIGRDKMLSLI